MRPAYPVKQQAAQRGIGFRALDNGFAACDDQAALAEICASLSAADVWAFFDRWQPRLPSPFTDRGPPARLSVRACVPAAGDL